MILELSLQKQVSDQIHHLINSAALDDDQQQLLQRTTRLSLLVPLS
jgi:hypothetical protein